MTLRLPLDGSLEAAVSQRPVKVSAKAVAFEEGKFGEAARVGEGGNLSLDIQRLCDGHKGAISLWLKLSKAIADTELPYNRLVHIQAAEEGFYNTFLRITAKNNKGLTVNVHGLGSEHEPSSAHGLSYNEAAAGWKAHEWHHVVLVWHCRQGVRFYDNGVLKYSSWGREKWVPCTPTALYLDSHPRNDANHPITFDEVRLYAEPLDDGHVLALFRGEDVRIERKAEDFAGVGPSAGELLAKELAGAANLPVLNVTPSPQAETTTVKQHFVRGAKVLKVSRREAADGQPRTAVQFSEPLEIDLGAVALESVELDGARPEAAIRVEGREIMPAASFEGRAASGKCVRWKSPVQLQVSKLQLAPRVPETSVSEARFYSFGKKGEAPGASTKVLTVADAFETGSLDAPGNPAAGPLFTLPQQALLAAQSAAPGKERTGQRMDIITEPFAVDTGVTAVGIEFKLSGPVPSHLRIKLTALSESERALFRMDAALSGGLQAPEGALSLIMDWPDYWVEKGDRLWLCVVFPATVKIAPGAKMVLYEAPLDAVKAEYSALQLGWFAQWYSGAAEAHAWDSASWKPTPEIRWLQNVRKADPDNPLAIAYYNRIFQHKREVEVAIPGPEKAPMWARAQREALRRTADVVHWWIDHRQSDDGQFGGGWNDDVELHGWDLLVLGCGDAKVLEALRKLNDGIWSPERFTDGYSNKIWDVEHAAEDSSYSQPRMVALQYGNPKWLERCMETIRNFGFWTAFNPKGHRHFKSFYFQAQKITDRPGYDSDMADCARAMKPGNYVMWYNDNELVKKWFREWADAWCEDSLKTERGKPAGVLPAEIVFATCELGRGDNKWNQGLKYPLGAITYHTEDEMIAVYLTTGDRKYLAPLEAMISHGRAADSTCVTWRRLTGDKKFDERFIAKAAGASGGANVIAWLATGDKKFLAEGCVETVRNLERSRYLLTEAEPPTDRVSLPGNMLLRQMMLGGVGVWVCGWPQMAVSWQQTGYDFAALVLESKPKRLKVLAYNFGPARKIQMCAWELERGTYNLKVGEDRNGDDAPDAAGQARRVEVERGLPIGLELAGDALSVIELEQVEARPLGKVADLAICREDVKPSEDGGAVTIQVHNIGSVPARDVQVALVDGAGQLVARETIAEIPSPDDLVAQVKHVTFKVPQGAATLRIVLDPDSKIAEITKLNNVLELGMKD